MTWWQRLVLHLFGSSEKDPFDEKTETKSIQPTFNFRTLETTINDLRSKILNDDINYYTYNSFKKLKRIHTDRLLETRTIHIDDYMFEYLTNTLVSILNNYDKLSKSLNIDPINVKTINALKVLNGSIENLIEKGKDPINLNLDLEIDFLIKTLKEENIYKPEAENNEDLPKISEKEKNRKILEYIAKKEGAEAVKAYIKAHPEKYNADTDLKYILSEDEYNRWIKTEKEASERYLRVNSLSEKYIERHIKTYGNFEEKTYNYPLVSTGIRPELMGTDSIYLDEIYGYGVLKTGNNTKRIKSEEILDACPMCGNHLELNRGRREFTCVGGPPDHAYYRGDTYNPTPCGNKYHALYEEDKYLYLDRYKPGTLLSVKADSNYFTSGLDY